MKVNKSKTYLSYYINKYIPIKFHNRLKNTYIAYNNDFYCWCMLYEFSGKIDFTTYEEELESNPYFIRTVDVDKKHTLYVFSIPEDIDDVIELFISGKYSRLPESDELIKYLVKSFNLPLNHNIVKVIKRDPSLRLSMENDLNVNIDCEMDLSDLPNLESENYIYS